MAERARELIRGLPAAVWPGLLLVVLAVGDVSNGTQHAILGLFAMVPLVAASLLDETDTGLYALAALAVLALLGIYNHTYSGSGLGAQLERLVGVAVSGAIGLAIARTRRLREDRLRSVTSIAEALQSVVLPEPPPEIGSIRVAVGYQSATRLAHIGGDFYDACATGTGSRLLIGDVSGKGIEAVRMAGAVLASFRERAGERTDLATLVADLDRAVRRETSGDEGFVTAAVAEFDDETKRLELVLAGHPAPLLIRDGIGRPLDAGRVCLPLGLSRSAFEAASTVEILAPGDRLLFYTDGTAEARSRADDYFPLTSVATELMMATNLGDAIGQMLQAVRAWTGNRLTDDAALLGVEVFGETARSAGIDLAAAQ